MPIEDMRAMVRGALESGLREALAEIMARQ